MPQPPFVQRDHFSVEMYSTLPEHRYYKPALEKGIEYYGLEKLGGKARSFCCASAGGHCPAQEDLVQVQHSNQLEEINLILTIGCLDSPSPLPLFKVGKLIQPRLLRRSTLRAELSDKDRAGQKAVSMKTTQIRAAFISVTCQNFRAKRKACYLQEVSQHNGPYTRMGKYTDFLHTLRRSQCLYPASLAYTLTQFPLFLHVSGAVREYLRTSATGTMCHSNTSRCQRPPLGLVDLLWGTRKVCNPPAGQLGQQRQPSRIATA